MDTATYSTSDFYLTCFLRYMEYRIHRLERDAGRITFIFEDEEDRAQLVLDYYNNDVTVHPLEFANVIRDTKAMMYQE